MTVDLNATLDAALGDLNSYAENSQHSSVYRTKVLNNLATEYFYEVRDTEKGEKILSFDQFIQGKLTAVDSDKDMPQPQKKEYKEIYQEALAEYQKGASGKLGKVKALENLVKGEDNQAFPQQQSDKKDKGNLIGDNMNSGIMALVAGGLAFLLGGEAIGLIGALIVAALAFAVGSALGLDKEGFFNGLFNGEKKPSPTPGDRQPGTDTQGAAQHQEQGKNKPAESADKNKDADKAAAEKKAEEDKTAKDAAEKKIAEEKAAADEVAKEAAEKKAAADKATKEAAEKKAAAEEKAKTAPEIKPAEKPKVEEKKPEAVPVNYVPLKNTHGAKETQASFWLDDYLGVLPAATGKIPAGAEQRIEGAYTDGAFNVTHVSLKNNTGTFERVNISNAGIRLPIDRNDKNNYHINLADDSDKVQKGLINAGKEALRVRALNRYMADNKPVIDAMRHPGFRDVTVVYAGPDAKNAPTTRTFGARIDGHDLVVEYVNETVPAGELKNSSDWDVYLDGKIIKHTPLTIPLRIKNAVGEIDENNLINIDLEKIKQDKDLKKTIDTINGQTVEEKRHFVMDDSPPRAPYTPPGDKALQLPKGRDISGTA